MFSKSRNLFGTREWSEFSFNIATGCSHGCVYCYARVGAIDKGWIENPEDWGKERINPDKVNMQHNRRASAVTMFPTTHDITPGVLNESLTAIDNILKKENHLLIVSKPHLSCIKAICDRFGGYREKILFRFTIGSMNESTSAYFEPGAPAPKERLDCLIHAKRCGFQTSVSIEPMLEDEIGTNEVIKAVYPYVTEDIWIGKMNSAYKRICLPEPEKKEALEYFRYVNSDSAVKALFERHKNSNKIKWKESIREVIERPSAADMDADWPDDVYEKFAALDARNS